MRGTDLVLLLSILLGCSLVYLSDGARNRRRDRSRDKMRNDIDKRQMKEINNLKKEMDKLQEDYKSMFQDMKSLQKKINAVDKGSAADSCVPLVCPLGFVKAQASSSKAYCFQFIAPLDNHKDQSWKSAQRSCNELGANLVTIDSKKKEKFIANYIKSNFATRKPVEMFTGLIATNELARDPYQIFLLQSSSTRLSQNSVRWTATREAVKDPTFKNIGKPHARWSPDIVGEKEGPNGSFQSCVTIRWPTEDVNSEERTPGMKRKKQYLTWRYHVCQGKNLGYICEIRLKHKKSKTKSKRRSRRSSPMSTICP